MNTKLFYIVMIVRLSLNFEFWSMRLATVIDMNFKTLEQDNLIQYCFKFGKWNNFTKTLFLYKENVFLI